MLTQFIVNGAVTGCFYGLVALGFGLIYNTTGIFHIAHGAVFTGAAYALYYFYRILGMPLMISVAVVVVFSMVAGMAFELIVYQPLKKKRASLAVSLIASLGIYIIFVNSIAMVFGNATVLLRSGPDQVFHFGEILVTKMQAYEVGCLCVSATALYIFLSKSRFGKAIKAIADNPSLALALGVDEGKTRLVIFSLGSAFAGLAGMLVGLSVGIDPNAGLNTVLVGAVAVIVGGVGRFIAPVYGALILGIVQGLVIWQISTRWQDMATFTVLVFFLLFRPRGLLGNVKRLEEV